MARRLNVSRDQCPVPPDDDTASQGKGDSLLENLGRSLHPDPMKVRKTAGQITGRVVGLVLQELFKSFLLRPILSVCYYFLLPWFLSD